MTRQSTVPIEKHHVFLYVDDWKFLMQWYGPRAPAATRIGVSAAIREIVHHRVQQLRAIQAASIDRRSRSTPTSELVGDS